MREVLIGLGLMLSATVAAYLVGWVIDWKTGAAEGDWFARIMWGFVALGSVVLVGLLAGALGLLVVGGGS